MSEIALGIIFYVSITLLGFAAGIYFYSRSRAHLRELEADWDKYRSRRLHEELLNMPSIHENWPIYADDGSVLTFRELYHSIKEQQPAYPDGGNIWMYNH